MLSRSHDVSGLFDRYQKGNFCKKRFEALLLEKILANPLFYTGNYCYQDDYADFAAWLYPRLGSAIDRYEVTGGGFAAYLWEFVCDAYHEFHMCEPEPVLYEKAVWPEQALVGMAEPSPCYTADIQDPPRACLPATGMGAAARTAMMNTLCQLRQFRQKREQRVRDLRERIYAQYYRCLLFQQRADTAAAGSALQRHWQGCYERGMRRLESMQALLRRIR